MLTVFNHYKTTIDIDGEAIAVRVKRFNRADDLWFVPTFEQIGREASAADEELKQFQRRYAAQLSADGGEAAALPPNDVYLAGLFEASLSPENRTARRAAELDRAERGAEFCRQAITRFITVDPGQIRDETQNRDVTNGEDLVSLFEGRPDVLRDLLAAIYLENRLSAEQKKTLSSLFDSTRTSAPSSTDAGPRPDATAAAAAPSTTATTARARARRAPSPSGAMSGSSVGSVPS